MKLNEITHQEMSPQGICDWWNNNCVNREINRSFALREVGPDEYKITEDSDTVIVDHCPIISKDGGEWVVSVPRQFWINQECKDVPFKLIQAQDVNLSMATIKTLDWLPPVIDGMLKIGKNVGITTFKGISRRLESCMELKIQGLHNDLHAGCLELAMINWRYPKLKFLLCESGAIIEGPFHLINKHINEYGPKQKILELREQMIKAGYKRYI